MKVLKKVMTVILVGVLLIGTTLSVSAEEITSVSSNYLPNEKNDSEMIDIMGRELQNGEKVVIGDYTVEYQEEIICLNPHSRETTKNYISTSHYSITNNGNSQEWYKVVQTTNYTYDGRTARINTNSCNLNVTKYYEECSYTINTNTVDNSSSTDPTYTIGLTMKLPSQSLTIVDVVTVHADGTCNKTHYE